MQYYVQLPNGSIVKCNWVTYELLVAYGWKHRLKEPGLAIIFKMTKKHKKKLRKSMYL